jgi:hypothetical protein
VIERGIWSRLGNAALLPVWLAQVLSAEKSFARNPVLGNLWLNERGLHLGRVRTAHRLAAARRRRLARQVASEDRAKLDRDGFLVKPDYLDPAVFEALQSQVRRLRADGREMVEGNTITRRIALGADTLRRVPAAAELLRDPCYRGLVSYAGASAAAPMFYIQSILDHAVEGPGDPQRDLHADTFHPTVKAWLFLVDVGPEDMPFTYVAGSHHLTPERLAWERRVSLEASHARRGTPISVITRMRRAISSDMLRELRLPEPNVVCASANTLLVADTYGFHARGPGRRGRPRVELWASSRRNPFLPWTGLDPWRIEALCWRKPAVYWKALDLVEAAGLGRNPWRRRMNISAFDPGKA